MDGAEGGMEKRDVKDNNAIIYFCILIYCSLVTKDILSLWWPLHHMFETESATKMHNQVSNRIRRKDAADKELERTWGRVGTSAGNYHIISCIMEAGGGRGR